MGTVAAFAVTSYMGLVERVNLGTWLLWMAVLGVVLLRRASLERGGVPGLA